ncbi:MAG TPA: SgcJ/EcaC family oxidoreductase, partial [Roseiarcus sp.]|nr:SgcJ/EcaC family oxidoreductase [Roseiarcus sp.]
PEGPSPAAGAGADSDEGAIRKVMASYNDALNGGSTAAVLPLYADDGVFMPPYSQSAVGKDAVRKAYDAVFKELKFDVKFTIAELVTMSANWAYVRTNSAGTTGHSSTGKTTSEANQELFIFRKGADGAWLIARYSFSPTNSPPS